jgi:D-threo-aldose 1-dehydrogenase
VSLAAVALQFPLEDPVVRSVVVGGVTPDQIRENLAHVSTPVPRALWTQLRDEGL